MKKTMGLRGLFNRKPAAAFGFLTAILVVVWAFSLRTSAVDPRVTLRPEPESYGGTKAGCRATWKRSWRAWHGAGCCLRGL